MKKLLLRVLIGFSILLFLTAGAGWWYVQKVFLPTKLKPVLINAAKSAGVKIDFKDITYKFPGGISITNLALFEKDIPTQKFLSAKETLIQFKLLPILTEKRITINRMELKTLQVYPSPGRTFISKGDAFIDGDFSCEFGNANKVYYNGILTLKNQNIKNMPLVKDISKLNGRIKIELDKISIMELKGTSYGCSVEFTGFLQDFKDPYLELSEIIKLDLSKMNYFLSPKVNKSLKEITFTGKSAVILNMTGRFSEWPLKFNGHANVMDAEAKIETLTNPIEAINGEVIFDENSLSITQIQAQYNNTAYTFKANLTDFTAPSIYVVLNSRDLLIETRLKAAEDYLRFDAIDGRWFNSSLNLVGEIQDYSNPRLKISGEAKIDLQDIKKMSLRILGENEKVLSILDGLKPKGVCEAALFLDGLVSDFKNCELGVKATSENISLRNFNLGTADISGRLKDKVLLLPKMDFTPYDGTLKIQSRVDFAEKDASGATPLYMVDLDMADVNLAKAVQDTDFKNKNIWGTLYARASLRGSGNDPNNLKGLGWIMVANGHLWEFPLFGGIANALGMPILTKIEIKEVSGNFSVKESRMQTQNLQFSSPQFNMLARGNLGFDGGLDFNIGLSFAQGFAQENQIAKLLTFIADETGRFLGELVLSGTLKEPKYKFVPLRLDKLFKNQLIEGLQKIFKR